MKKLICLALCLVMVMSMFLVGCKNEEGPIEGEEEEEEVRNAITLKFYIVTDEVTTEEAKDAMQDAFNKVAREKYSTQVEFVFATEDEYKSVVDNALATAKENLSRGAKKPSAVYEGYVPETVLDEFNLPELVYPELIENQIDIVLITSKEMLEEYIDAGHLVDITKLIDGDFDTVKEYINTSLLTNAKIKGKWYSIPSNVVVGSYDYLLINKELASNYYLVESDFISVDENENEYINYLTCLDFAKSIANDTSLKGVAPIKEKFDYPSVKFWSDGGEPFAVASFYNAYTGLGDYITVSNAFENQNYIDYLKFATESATNGYYASSEAEEYGIKLVTDDYASRFKYEEDNFVVVLDTPRVYSSDGFDSMFAVTNYSASVNRSVELIQDLVTDSELCNILLYGVEGSDYYLNEDDTVTRMGNSYKMSNKHVGNVFMTYPCTNDGMFADYWRYGMLQNQEASSEPLEGCSAEYVWKSVRDGIIEDQLTIKLRAEHLKVTMKDYAADDYYTYKNRLIQYYSGIDPDSPEQDPIEETIAQFISNIEKRLLLQYETADGNSRVKKYALSTEDLQELCNAVDKKYEEDYSNVINVNTRRINQRIFTDDDVEYTVLQYLKSLVIDKIDKNAKALVNETIGESGKSGFTLESEIIADETIAKVKAASASFFETINACTTAEEIEAAINGENGILAQMKNTTAGQKEVSSLFYNSRTGAWIADKNIPFGMLQVNYNDKPVKSAVAGVVLAWYRSILK